MYNRILRITVWTGLVAGLLWGLAAHAAEARRYDGYRVVRTWIADSQQWEAILALEVDIWSENPGWGPVDILLAPEQADALDQLGLRYTVVIDDVQRRIDGERATAGREWFEDYHPYADIVGYLSGLATNYPSLAQMVNVGTTVEGRTIWGLRIASPTLPAHAPAVVYFAGVHAREWITVTVPQYLANYLLTQYGIDPVVTDLVNHVEWFLIPSGNPDGYVYTWESDRLWRKNRRDNGNGTFGVDINRNWGYGWGLSGSSGTPSSLTYRGPYPFSEPETCALRDMFLTHPNTRAQNDLHSYSQLILWPWGYTAQLPDNNAEYQTVGQSMHDLILAVHGLNYNFGPTYTTIYAASGTSVDWTHGQRGVFSFSFELRDTGTYGFLLPANQIIPNNEEVLPALLHLANCPQVRATQITFPDGRPSQLIAGQDTTITVVITSGVEALEPGTATLYYRYDPAGPYQARPLTPSGGALFAATLPATNCASSPQYYISITGDLGTTTAPPDAPATVYSATMVSGGLLLDADLNTDPGWTCEGLWAWGQPAGGGGSHGFHDPNSGHTDRYVYGYNLAGDYTNNLPARHLTSTPVNCTRQYGVRLSFWRWLGVEAPPWDRAAVSVSRDGTTWVTLWENTAEVADNQWVYQDFDISAVADNQPTVYLRWTMGPTDTAWTYCGWNIDDIQVYATGCIGLPGDFDGDGQLGPTDFLGLVDCLTGPDQPRAPGCTVFDATGDSDVDLADSAAFQTLFSR